MRIVRRTPWFVRALAVAWCAALASPAVAQETPATGSGPEIASASLALTAASLREASPQRQVDAAPPQPLFGTAAPEKPRRPAALIPLYGSLVALQGMDIHSTRRALDTGSGHEANPAMREVVNNGAAFLAVKTAATAGVIWASEKMWKKNRKAAVIFAAAVNGTMAAIVANNYRINRQLSRR